MPLPLARPRRWGDRGHRRRGRRVRRAEARDRRSLSRSAEETPWTIVREARAESPLWGAALRPRPAWEPVFSLLVPELYALGLETIYEAYLVHYGVARLFAPVEESERVLLGDYLYAHGLLRIAEAGGVDAVSTMAELISRCSALRAAGEPGEGAAWVEAARSLGGELQTARGGRGRARRASPRTHRGREPPPRRVAVGSRRGPRRGERRLAHHSRDADRRADLPGRDRDRGARARDGPPPPGAPGRPS